MAQFIGIVLIFVLIKLLFDLIKPVFQKVPPTKKGDFIDISEKWINADEMPYQKSVSVLNNSELRVLRLFQNVLAQSRYGVYPHLRLADLLQVPAVCQNRQEYLFRIKERSLDLVILDADQLQPLLVVNFENPTNGKREQITDQFTEKALQSAGFKWMTVDPNKPPSREQLLADLQRFGIVP